MPFVIVLVFGDCRSLCVARWLVFVVRYALSLVDSCLLFACWLLLFVVCGSILIVLRLLLSFVVCACAVTLLLLCCFMLYVAVCS